MIVILMKDVKGSGKAGDVVKVSDGYARNMLLPKGLAKEATEGNIRSLEKQKAIAAEKLEEQKAAAKEMAAKLEKITLKIESKSGIPASCSDPSLPRILRKHWKNRKA